MQLETMDIAELRKVISKANVVLNRKNKVEKAKAEISKTLKTHKLSDVELKSILSSLCGPNRGSIPKKRKSRPKVTPKYKSKDGKNTWSGRGRSPAWVVNICQNEDLNITEFKADPRFLI